MRIVSVQTLRTYWEANPDVEQQLRAWHDEVISQKWEQPADIKARYASASILKKRRVVFNIKGNKYRLIVGVAPSLLQPYAHAPMEDSTFIVELSELGMLPEDCIRAPLACLCSCWLSGQC